MLVYRNKIWKKVHILQYKLLCKNYNDNVDLCENERYFNSTLII